ncbi:MAG: D-alanyl-D-alanine carboxypeptidase/D-alanyl-D-alanine-endopeptidase [Methanomicrobiales archaeon]|nr:D-alanyl-D-alanine carboxypeptidase/D-alanyl-D-alanine-endopeptidase [Methanomicrobiales archaeon]
MSRNTLAFFAALCLLLAGLICAAGCLKPAETSPSTVQEPLSGLDAITGEPRYAFATWGIRAVDTATGEVLVSRNADALFAAGSTTKCFTVAAALDTFGPGYRFATPVFARGTLSPDGVLDGVLILAASGDPTMGGRTLPDGTIAFTSADHGDANALGGAVLTATDPLAGLDVLARQVGHAGIARVSDVVIDDRLFETVQLADDNPVTPIIINDNLIDVIITPAGEGEPAHVGSRPETSVWSVNAAVTTGEAATVPDIRIEGGTGIIMVSGTVPAGGGVQVRTFRPPDAAGFARSLFIEALERAGVGVDAPADGANPVHLLPGPEASDMSKVAELVSPPLSENAKLILKVSQNLHANTLLGIMAAYCGERTVYDGLAHETFVLEMAGIDDRSLTLVDGEGSMGNRISPDAMTLLLQYMEQRPYAGAFREALPVLGVDGTLASAVSPGSPARGKVQAKTGTVITQDMAGLFLHAKAMAGYITAKSGRELAFAVFVNDVRITSVDDAMAVGSDLAGIAEYFYETF